jgi:hypothetical protein
MNADLAQNRKGAKGEADLEINANQNQQRRKAASLFKAD